MVPQTTEKSGQVIRSVPSVRIPERIVEQDFCGASDHGEFFFASCVEDQIVEVPVLLIMETIVGTVFGLPQERVQNRATYTRKVFTVCHHFDDQACTVPSVGFIKGLDKFNMPRPGDVVVPVPQINQGTEAVTQQVPQEPIELVPAGHVEQVVSWFDRKSQAAPLDEPFYRFQTKRSGRSSHSKLKRS